MDTNELGFITKASRSHFGQRKYRFVSKFGSAVGALGSYFLGVRGARHIRVSEAVDQTIERIAHLEDNRGMVAFDPNDCTITENRQ